MVHAHSASSTHWAQPSRRGFTASGRAAAPAGNDRSGSDAGGPAGAPPQTFSGTHQNMPRDSALDDVATGAAQAPGDPAAEQLARAGAALEGPDVDLRGLDHHDAAAPPGLRARPRAPQSFPGPAARAARRAADEAAAVADDDDEPWFSVDPAGDGEGGAGGDDYFGRPEVLPQDTSPKPALVAKYLSLVRAPRLAGRR